MGMLVWDIPEQVLVLRVGYFFSVNEYFGAYNEETGEDILSDVSDNFADADPLDQAGNQW